MFLSYPAKLPITRQTNRQKGAKNITPARSGGRNLQSYKAHTTRAGIMGGSAGAKSATVPVYNIISFTVLQ